MSDKEFLIWIHDRMKWRYGENENNDYMRRLLEVSDRVERLVSFNEGLAQENHELKLNK
jgi:hypothetical protein